METLIRMNSLFAMETWLPTYPGGHLTGKFCFFFSVEPFHSPFNLLGERTGVWVTTEETGRNSSQRIMQDSLQKTNSSTSRMW